MNFIVLNANQKNTYLQANFMRINSLLYIALTYLNSLKKSNKQRQFILQSTINSWLNYKGSVFDSENTISILYVNTQDKALKEKMDTLINYKRILAKLYQTLPQNNDYKSWQEKIKNIENKITELTTSIASKAESFKEQEGLKSISYTDISTNLKENELYIDYAKGGEFYYIFTLDKYNNISFYQIDVKKSQTIEQLIASFREDIQKLIGSKGTLSIHSKEKLSALYQLLIQEPLSKELKQYSNLIISPDGALRLLPFEALYDTKAQKYLIESKEIRYIPSGKELVRLYKYASKSSNPTPNAAIISNPNFDYVNTANKSVDIGVTPNTNQVNIVKSLFKMHFTPLLGTKIEAENITKILKPTTTITNYQEDRANETNLMRLLSPNILHIATHGFFINDANVPNPMLKSGIALSGANESAKSKEGEGIVTALKLSGLKLKSTDLVVLSACETGVVDINDTDSVSGLGKAFIQAGAKDIVMSLWSVDDNATKDLMIDFYQGIQHNSNYAKALKEAKLKMITQGKHPFFWAGFVLSGL
jgi:CHAT domain-containing protein